MKFGKSIIAKCWCFLGEALLSIGYHDALSNAS